MATMAVRTPPYRRPDDHERRLRGPVSDEETQGDGGARLDLGGLVGLVLLAGLARLGLLRAVPSERSLPGRPHGTLARCTCPPPTP